MIAVPTTLTTATVVDGDGQVLSHAVLWPDGRVTEWREPVAELDLMADILTYRSEAAFTRRCEVATERVLWQPAESCRLSPRPVAHVDPEPDAASWRALQGLQGGRRL